MRLNVYHELKEECKILNLVSKNDEVDKLLALCLSSKISFAYKHDMVTLEQLNDLRTKVLLLVVDGA